MKILFVAPANSVHTIKLCKWFAERGHIIEIITFEKNTQQNPYAMVHSLPVGIDVKSASSFQKIRYLFHGRMIRDLVHAIHPDIINVHYASSYGTAVALANIKSEYVLSAWGSDIYSFPKRSMLHRKILEYSLDNASYIFATSMAMVGEVKRYTNTEVFYSPFGVDTEIFCPCKKKHNDFVIGIIKSLNLGYGIEHLLLAAAILQKEYPSIPLRVRVGGEGEYEDKFRKLAKQMKVEKITTWLGWLSEEQVAAEWAHFDIGVIPSDFESFGVSALEAQACAIPLVVSDAPGFFETTCPGITSVVVPRGDVKALVDAILRLYYDEGLRERMGEAGRRFVLEKYQMSHCYRRMENFFECFMDRDNSVMGIE